MQIVNIGGLVNVTVYNEHTNPHFNNEQDKSYKSSKSKEESNSKLVEFASKHLVLHNCVSHIP